MVVRRDPDVNERERIAAARTEKKEAVHGADLRD